MSSSEESRAHEKAIYSYPYSHSASLLFRNGSPLVKEELLLYALVCTCFPENGYNIKAKLADKFDPIIHAFENVYQINFKSHDLRNYIYRATHNLVTGLGKVKAERNP